MKKNDVTYLISYMYVVTKASSAPSYSHLHQLWMMPGHVLIWVGGWVGGYLCIGLIGKEIGKEKDYVIVCAISCR